MNDPSRPPSRKKITFEITCARCRETFEMFTGLPSKRLCGWCEWEDEMSRPDEDSPNEE